MEVAPASWSARDARDRRRPERRENGSISSTVTLPPFVARRYSSCSVDVDTGVPGAPRRRHNSSSDVRETPRRCVPPRALDLSAADIPDGVDRRAFTCFLKETGSAASARLKPSRYGVESEIASAS